MKRHFTRREFIATTAKLGAASSLGSMLPLPRLWLRQAGAATFFTADQRQTLDAALRRMIPANGPGDWDAASVGAGDYIEGLLSLDLGIDPKGTIFAGGPFREPDPPISTTGFSDFQTLSRVKREGWKKEIDRLRNAYTAGLQKLDDLAGGDFAAIPAEAQDAILTALDLASKPGDFFAALYAHTMEGVYGHPVYGGNKNYQAWNSLSYQGDVHGVRYPDGKDFDDNAWNKFGGYSPDEMKEPD